MKKILVVGDLYVPIVAFRTAFASLLPDNAIRFIQMNGQTASNPAPNQRGLSGNIPGIPDKLQTS